MQTATGKRSASRDRGKHSDNVYLDVILFTLLDGLDGYGLIRRKETVVYLQGQRPEGSTVDRTLMCFFAMLDMGRLSGSGPTAVGILILGQDPREL